MLNIPARCLTNFLYARNLLTKMIPQQNILISSNTINVPTSPSYKDTVLPVVWNSTKKTPIGTATIIADQKVAVISSKKPLPTGSAGPGVCQSITGTYIPL